MKELSYLPRHPDASNWKSRHMREVRKALRSDLYGGLSVAVISGIGAWIEYARAHLVRYESPIGEDYVLGPAWARWGLALRELLNGDMGDADCGTLNTIINDNLDEQGFTEGKRGEL